MAKVNRVESTDLVCSSCGAHLELVRTDDGLWRVYCPGSGLREDIGKGCKTRWGALRWHKKCERYWDNILNKIMEESK